MGTQQLVLGNEPRQITSLLGHLERANMQALAHGLNRQYYSMAINYRKTELEQDMLMNLHKKSWVDGLTLRDYQHHCKSNRENSAQMLKLAKAYNKSLEEEDKMTAKQLELKNVGKMDPKRHLEETVDVLMNNNVVQCLGSMLSTVVFK